MWKQLFFDPIANTETITGFFVLHGLILRAILLPLAGRNFQNACNHSDCACPDMAGKNSSCNFSYIVTLRKSKFESRVLVSQMYVYGLMYVSCKHPEAHYDALIFGQRFLKKKMHFKQMIVDFMSRKVLPHSGS